ncbi:MAG TPA: BTAD domain-containing putative transcriptional regulator [Mycobacteriales bacterium]|nr:BTAD domain-containing putative transcriptional regulator [Mycobacteriales bacterium]
MARFQVLGPVQLTGRDSAVNLGGDKCRCLLANLLIEPGRTVPTETLMDHAWGAGQPARSTLHRYVTRLRGALAAAGVNPGTLRGTANGYVLDIAPDSLDLHQFRERTRTGRASAAAGDDDTAAGELRQGLDQWSGDALANVTGDWAERIRHGLERNRLDALTAWAQAELRRGRHAQVLDELVTLAGRHPDEEPLAAALMLAHARCGQHTEALRRYHLTRQHLVGTLGSEPGPELRGLFHRLLQAGKQPEPSPPRTSGRRPGPAASGDPGSGRVDRTRQPNSGRPPRDPDAQPDDEAEPRGTQDAQEAQHTQDRLATGDQTAHPYSSFHGPTVIHGDLVGRDKIVIQHSG